MAALAGLAPLLLAGRRKKGGDGPGWSLQRARRRNVVVDQSNLPAPNVLFVFTDDQPPHTVPAMEKTLARFGDGANLTANAYTAVPLCGPARCTVLSGLYQHSHGVFGNAGAFGAYRSGGHPSRDLFSRIKASPHSYRMGFFGKYLNDYEFHKRYVHPAFGGEDRWRGLADGQGQMPYTVNTNGTLREVDREHTPYFGEWAELFIRNSASETRPWFCALNWTDPHLPYRATDIQGSYSSPATEETDLSDKSDYTRSKPRRGPDHHRNVHQGQGGEVERLDIWMEALFRTLEETGQLESTVVIYSSDNGFLTGEHGGLTKKSMPYGESARAPFLIRGPGFGAIGGSPLVSHVDIPATICAVAGADASGLEGRDLRGLWTGEPWRERLLVELTTPDGEAWSMVREGSYAYTDFRGTVRDKEMYDLSADPYETESLLYNPTPEAEAKAAELSARLETLKAATGDGIRAAETA